MAIYTNTQETFTYNSLTNPEDVADIIAVIDPTDTPFLSGLRRTKANNTKHEFINDSLNAAANNAQIEGDQFWSAVQTRPTPVRLWNRTQISYKIVAVSRTQIASGGYGMKNLLAYEMNNVAKELKRDQEFALTQNAVTVAGNATTARQLRGLLGWVQSNFDQGSGGARSASNYTSDPGTAPTAGTQRTLTESMVKNVLQQCFTAGGNPTMIMAGPSQKQTFSTFTGNTTRISEVPDGGTGQKLVTSIAVYVSDFGSLKVVPNRFQRARDLFVLDMNYWALAEMTPPTMLDLPPMMDGQGKALVTEYTLEARQEKASGIVADLL